MSRRQGPKELFIGNVTEKIKLCPQQGRPIKYGEIDKYLIGGIARKEHKEAHFTLKS